MTTPKYAPRSRTKVNAIPDVTDRNVVEAVRKIKAIIDAREGVSGDPVDRFVTFRDLIQLGLGRNQLGKEHLDSELVVGSGLFELPIAPLPYFRPQMYEGSQDQTPPPRPTDLTASTVGTVVLLNWTIRDYYNHAYFEVWRGTSTTFSSAVLIGSPVGLIYADPTGTEDTYYYWVRAVTQARVKGNLNSTNGTAVS